MALTVTSRTTLIEYCLRKLGAPVLEINVDDDQISDRIDDALQFYQEYHFDSMIKVYHQYVVTATDIANQYITVPDYITFVQRILPVSSMTTSSSMFSVQYQFAMSDLYPFTAKNSVSEYEMLMSKLSLLDMSFGSAEGIRYNRKMDRLYVDIKWGDEIKAGEYLVIEAHRIVDPSTYPQVYNDMFLKKYATALIMKQWGQNIIKFEGMQLPGGVTMNGRQIFDTAVQEIQQLEADMENKYQEPVDFFVG